MTKKWQRRIWPAIGILVVAAIIAAFALKKGDKKAQGAPTIKVTRTNIVEKALAVGTIEPLNEIQVKSKVSGVVQKLFVDIGDYVEANTSLMEVRPDPTPLELVDARREVEMATIELDNLRRELERKDSLKKKGLISDQEYEQTARQYDQSALSVKTARERLALIEKGKVKIAETSIETVVKAPISGFILARNVAIGDPVVPLTSYQPGTPLITMANMANLLFKGTVDEIDVGKIREGMSTEIQVGALPGKTVPGKVLKISLKAQKEENVTVFPVEIAIESAQDVVLRAGYSANANIIIQKRDSVLTIPERIVTFRNDSAFVRLPKPGGTPTEKYIQTGLTDALNIEVISGLSEGQEVLEKEVKLVK